MTGCFLVLRIIYKLLQPNRLHLRQIDHDKLLDSCNNYHCNNYNLIRLKLAHIHSMLRSIGLSMKYYQYLDFPNTQLCCRYAVYHIVKAGSIDKRYIRYRSDQKQSHYNRNHPDMLYRWLH